MMGKRMLRLIKKPPQLAYALGLGPLVGRLVLLLTTTGRRSGLPRVTPLQFEEIDGCYHIGSMRGVHADWVRNILADPQVQVRVGNRKFAGVARIVTDPQQLADFIAYRLAKRPRMIGRILRTQGVSANPSRQQLERYAENRALVIIRPVRAENEGGR